MQREAETSVLKATPLGAGGPSLMRQTAAAAGFGFTPGEPIVGRSLSRPRSPAAVEPVAADEACDADNAEIEPSVVPASLEGGAALVSA